MRVSLTHADLALGGLDRVGAVDDVAADIDGEVTADGAGQGGEGVGGANHGTACKWQYQHEINYLTGRPGGLMPLTKACLDCTRRGLMGCPDVSAGRLHMRSWSAPIVGSTASSNRIVGAAGSACAKRVLEVVAMCDYTVGQCCLDRPSAGPQSPATVKEKH